MLDWHSCQICYPLEIKILLLLLLLLPGCLIFLIWPRETDTSPELFFMALNLQTFKQNLKYEAILHAIVAVK